MQRNRIDKHGNIAGSFDEVEICLLITLLKTTWVDNFKIRFCTINTLPCAKDVEYTVLSKLKLRRLISKQGIQYLKLRFHGDGGNDLLAVGAYRRQMRHAVDHFGFLVDSSKQPGKRRCIGGKQSCSP